MRIKNSLYAVYRGTNNFTLARTFKTVWGQNKYGASENVPPGYFTLLVQNEFAGGLADRCAEETGEEGMILET